MKVVAVLPAKGSSERIASKNLKVLAGKPLFLHTLENLMKCEFIDEVYLDTESDALIEVAKHTGCRVLKRDASLASNATDGHGLFMNQVKNIDADIYIHILGTSPFISKKTIKQGLEALIKNDEYDSAVLFKKDKLYTWKNSKPEYNLNHIPNSKDLDDTVIESMGLYIVKKETALKFNRRFGESVYCLEADAVEHIDVNYQDEFDLAELIMLGINQKEATKLNVMKKYINSSLISDTLDELGEPNRIITGIKPNIKNSKIFGRAKTLKIRALMNEDEDFKGIYEALNSYETVSHNDIIVVENECNDLAYFGELNSQLAIRSGASGVIIDGVTRDSESVEKNALPVFARGYNCKDVKYRATMESFNRTINISNVEIKPNDLIFADNDGIVVIPKNIEDRLFEMIVESFVKENKVLTAIIKGDSPADIINNIGLF